MRSPKLSVFSSNKLTTSSILHCGFFIRPDVFVERVKQLFQLTENKAIMLKDIMFWWNTYHAWTSISHAHQICKVLVASFATSQALYEDKRLVSDCQWLYTFVQSMHRSETSVVVDDHEWDWNLSHVASTYEDINPSSGVTLLPTDALDTRITFFHKPWWMLSRIRWLKSYEYNESHSKKE